MLSGRQEEGVSSITRQNAKGSIDQQFFDNRDEVAIGSGIDLKISPNIEGSRITSNYERVAAGSRVDGDILLKIEPQSSILK